MKNLFRILMVLALVACNKRFPYETGRFPEDSPVNLADLNTEYDEMNSDFVSDYIQFRNNFLYSSNASSGGVQFDLEPRALDFIWDKNSGKLSFIAPQNYEGYQFIRSQLSEINSNCNERGPYSISLGLTLFSADCEENSKIHINEFKDNGIAEGYTSKTTVLDLLSGNSNEMYPSFYGSSYIKGAGVESQGRPEKMLFSSDRDGAFDIYELDLPAEGSVMEYLQSTQEKNIQKTGINTSNNDHMPFVYGDLLVFSSDRPGGFGGHDLYYSFRTGDGWGEPENFGPKINSEFDEFRPVVTDSWEFENQLMIFSSDRPGGLGGFDLYFVGIPKF